MDVFHEIAPLRQFIHSRKNKGRIALVPTMGNLHQGHMQLVERAKQEADSVVVSLFVNPLQFAPNEDFDSYPRTEAQDLEKLSIAGVDGVFIPDCSIMYGEDRDRQTQVFVPTLSKILCGVSRAGFFQGITTVVSKIFNIVQPDLAVFGEKDFQQLIIIKTMVSDLNFPIEILGVPTVREHDGLACSSRNRYLSVDQRTLAPKLYHYLKKLGEALKADIENYARSIGETKQALGELEFDVDYLELRHAEDLAAPQEGQRQFVILIAANLGATRLIDNLVFEL